VSAVVVRFSSLGDVVLCGAVTSALHDVTFVTLPRYREVAERLRGVGDVLTPLPGEGLRPLARSLPAGALRIDLHGSLRSRALALRAGGQWRRFRKQTFKRSLRVAFKTAPACDVTLRYAASASLSPAPLPWISVGPGPKDHLLLAPGSNHATKRWPAGRFAAVAASWDGPVAVLGGPGEEALCAEVATRAGRPVEVACGQGFSRAFDLLSRASVLLGGDTGLAQLASAAGVPTVVLFGPTTSADGFWGGRCRPVEASLPCRPCSRWGRDRCPIGDHLCMDMLSIAIVENAVHGTAWRAAR
jgi:ADP-heptose:LPS heptosyltransferase